MTREMTGDEWQRFLLARPRTAKLATVRNDGRPHVAPIWFDLDGDELLFTTGETTIKGHAIRRDARVCLCVDDEEPPFSFVVVEGAASISTDVDQLRYWAARIGGRYMGPERAGEYGARNAVAGELLVRVEPTRVVARAGIAD